MKNSLKVFIRRGHFMIDFEYSFIILGKAGMSQKSDFSLFIGLCIAAPRLYTGYFTYPFRFYNVTLFLNQHKNWKVKHLCLKTKVTVWS